jgi:hypothetical protein
MSCTIQNYFPHALPCRSVGPNHVVNMRSPLLELWVWRCFQSLPPCVVPFQGWQAWRNRRVQLKSKWHGAVTAPVSWTPFSSISRHSPHDLGRESERGPHERNAHVARSTRKMGLEMKYLCNTATQDLQPYLCKSHPPCLWILAHILYDLIPLHLFHSLTVPILKNAGAHFPTCLYVSASTVCFHWPARTSRQVRLSSEHPRASGMYDKQESLRREPARK